MIQTGEADEQLKAVLVGAVLQFQGRAMGMNVPRTSRKYSFL